jgi:hypothetical protein
VRLAPVAVLVAGTVAAIAPERSESGTHTAPVSAATAPVEPEDTWITDGEVYAIEADERRVFLGGWFTLVGPPTGQGAALDPTTGARDSAYARVDGGPVHAVVPDGAGGFFIGGDFTSVGGVPRARLAHILASGALDPTWNPGADRPVRALVRVGTRLYVGGEFQGIGGAPQPWLAALDASSGAVVTGWRPALDGAALALTATSTTVYAGGDFGSVNAAPRGRGAAFDATTGALLAWHPRVDSPWRVNALAASGAHVYVGGDFPVLDGRSRYYLARVDATTGAPDAAWNPNPSWPVHTLLVANSRLYVGGEFGRIAGATRSAAAAFDLPSGALASWNPDVGDKPPWALQVSSLASYGSRILLGGTFGSIGGQERLRLAAVDATTGALDAAFDPRPNHTVLGLAVSSSRIYAGGRFGSVNGVIRRNLAALDVATGSVETAWRADTKVSAVTDLELVGGRLYVSGSFLDIAGTDRDYLAALDATTASLLPWNPAPNTIVGDIEAIAGRIVAGGGWFSHIGGRDERMLASLDPITGEAAPWGLAPDDDVFGIVGLNERAYVVGEFGSIGRQWRANGAAVDASSGALLPWDPHTNRTIWQAAATPARIYLVGNFDSVGNEPRLWAGAVDTETGHVDANWVPVPGDNSSFWAVTTHGSRVFLGGGFTEVGGVRRDRLVEVDPVTGVPTPWWPSLDFTVRDIEVTSTHVYVGGDFENRSRVQRGFAAFALPPATTDTTAPDTTIRTGPSGGTRETSASFSFSSSEPVSGFACRLDADAWAPCASPKSYSGLRAGGHTFSVRATDVAGNTDATPATWTWTIETSASSPPPPPAPPTPQAPPGSAIRGTSGPDVLVGTARRDVIYGGSGNDVVRGRGGNDTIYGGAGRDRISGGSGRDRLVGGLGRDTLLARDRARDAVFGGRARDRARVDRLLDVLRSVEVRF